MDKEMYVLRMGMGLEERSYKIYPIVEKGSFDVPNQLNFTMAECRDEAIEKFISFGNIERCSKLKKLVLPNGEITKTMLKFRRGYLDRFLGE